jgi:hypothetical protein
MTWRHVNNALATALMVLTMWTGFVAASAHGQVRADGTPLVLCSADGPVLIVLGADGKPTGKALICPDLAPGLIAALELAAAVIPGATWAFREATFTLGQMAPREILVARARARSPPLVV